MPLSFSAGTPKRRCAPKAICLTHLHRARASLCIRNRRASPCWSRRGTIPAAMGTRKIAPALAAGCPVVIKPASETPLTMLALMPILEEAGVPAGVVNVLPSRSSGAVVGAMLSDPRTRVVSFTGSTEVGRKLLHAAADNCRQPCDGTGRQRAFHCLQGRRYGGRCRWPDGRQDAQSWARPARRPTASMSMKSVEKPFVETFTAKMAALRRWATGWSRYVDVGPLVNAETRDKVDHFRARRGGKGAELKLGGTRPNGPGFFYPPTVSGQCTRHCRVPFRRDLRPRRRDPELHRRRRDHRAGQCHRIRPGRLSVFTVTCGGAWRCPSG